jgi:hypothetical protein
MLNLFFNVFLKYYNSNHIYTSKLNVNKNFIKIYENIEIEFPTIENNNELIKYKNMQKFNIMLLSDSNIREKCNNLYSSVTQFYIDNIKFCLSLLCLYHLCRDKEYFKKILSLQTETEIEKYYFELISLKTSQINNKLLTSNEIWCLIDIQWMKDIIECLQSFSSTAKTETKQIKNYQKEIKKEEIEEEKEVREPLPQKTYSLYDDFDTNSMNDNEDEHYQIRYNLLNSKTLDELKTMCESVEIFIEDNNKKSYINELIHYDWLF